MIDIDTPEEAKLFLKITNHLNLHCSVLKTSKGIHADFKGNDLKANQIEWYSPIGIQVTTRLGTKNTTDPLRIAGKTRKWLRKLDKHEPLLRWLNPMDKRKNHITDI